VMIVVALVLYFSVWGLEVRAIGSDIESAYCTEVNVKKVRSSVFVVSGGLAALSGVLVSLILNTGNFTVGTGWELIAVAGCAIGGISLFGYEGSLFGLFCGLLTLQIIQNGIVVIGISPYCQQIIIGLILLAAMVMEVRRRQWFNLEKL
jgi:ribose transport system permease protein